MIKLFRRAHERLLTENIFSKYMLYALCSITIGEITLVVIGILNARQIDNWNEGRK